MKISVNLIIPFHQISFDFHLLSLIEKLVLFKARVATYKSALRSVVSFRVTTSSVVVVVSLKATSNSLHSVARVGLSAALTIGVVALGSSHQIATLSSAIIEIVIILSLLHLLASIVIVSVVVLESSLRAASSGSVASLSRIPDLVPHVSHLASNAPSILSSTSLVSIAILVSALSVASYNK